MYCVKCGVELADSEKACPLCHTPVLCPEGMKRNEAEPLYPPHPGALTEGVSKSGIMFLLSFLCFVPLVICLLCDLRLNGGVVWSGYVMGAILLLYTICFLPGWFRRPNPVIFAPIDFAAIAGYLLYIHLITKGNWYFTLALPTLGALALTVVTVLTLTRYTKGGELFIYSGALLFLGTYMIPLELLVNLTFGIDRMFRWSLYPFTGFLLLGGFLLVVGICRPLRESLRRRLFF